MNSFSNHQEYITLKQLISLFSLFGVMNEVCEINSYCNPYFIVALVQSNYTEQKSSQNKGHLDISMVQCMIAIKYINSHHNLHIVVEMPNMQGRHDVL